MLISDSASSHNWRNRVLLMIVITSMNNLYLIEWAMQLDLCGGGWHKHLLVSVSGEVSQQVFAKFFCFILLLEPFIHEHFLLLIICL